MASSSSRKPSICQVFLIFLVLAYPCYGFYHAGSYKHIYISNDLIFAKVNSLTSILSELPFSYYSLPYCKPHQGIRKSTENIGQLLMGDQINNSPYRFRMNVNETVYLCTTDPLSKLQVNLLKQRTRDLYRVNMILDNLPVMRSIEHNGFKTHWNGFPVGHTPRNHFDDYINNHLKFTILVNENEKASAYVIVGFQITPCSVRYDPERMKKFPMYENIPHENFPMGLEKYQIIREKEQVSFTYEVQFVKSDVKWSSRWDEYSRMQGSRTHWFSILNSLVVIFFLTGLVFDKLLRVRRDLTRYEESDKESRAKMDEELSGWRLMGGDVFREPVCSKLLCVMVANGVQIFGVAIITVVCTAFGFMSPAPRGSLLTVMIMLYLFLGIVSGYVGVHMWRIIKGTTEGWRSVSGSIACFFPGIVLMILTPSNSILYSCKSTGFIPISLSFKLVSLWFFISVPLTLLGGFLATRAEEIQHPIKTNQIPKDVPTKKFPSWLLILAAGTIPFGTLFVEYFSILFNICFGRFYYAFGVLSIVLFLLVIVCAEVSILLTYKHLCLENWKWWWKAFFASASVSLYVFLYSIYYLVFHLSNLNGIASVILYLGYSLIIAIAVMLSTGAIGFLMSFYFVHYLYSLVKIE